MFGVEQSAARDESSLLVSRRTMRIKDRKLISDAERLHYKLACRKMFERRVMVA